MSQLPADEGDPSAFSESLSNFGSEGPHYRVMAESLGPFQWS